MKRLMWILVLLMLPALMCFSTADAATEAKIGVFYDVETGESKEMPCEDVYEYSLLQDNSIRIDWVDLERGRTVLVLPSELNGLPVSALASDALTDYELRITKELVMPACIKTIQSADGLGGKKYLELPQRIEKITFVEGEPSFEVENGLLYQDNVLMGCMSSLVGSDVVIRPGTRSADLDALQKCESIKTISIPASLTQLDFERQMLDGYLDELTAFIVAEDNANYSSQDGVLYYNHSLWSCPRQISADVLRVKEGTKTIAEGAFWNCDGIGAVEFPDGLLRISKDAFFSCNAMTRLWIPASVQTIAEGAFAYCWNLQELELDAGNEAYTLRENLLVEEASHKIILAFSNGKTAVTIPEDILAIGTQAFTCCASVETVRLNQGLKRIGEAGFAYTGLTAVELPSALETLGDGAFDVCEQLAEVSFADNRTMLKSIPDYCFTGTAISKLELPAGSSITSIGRQAFGGCKELVSVELPEGLKQLSNWAFDSCKKLEEVVIPSSLTSVGMYAFDDCVSLKELTLPQELQTFDLRAVFGCKGLKKLVIPEKTSLDGYRSDDLSVKWIVVAPDSKAQEFCKEERIDYCWYDELPFLSGTLQVTACDEKKISTWLNRGTKLTFSFDESKSGSWVGKRSGQMTIKVEAPDGSVAQRTFDCLIQEGMLGLDEGWLEMQVDEHETVRLITDQWTMTLEGAAA